MAKNVVKLVRDSRSEEELDWTVVGVDISMQVTNLMKLAMARKKSVAGFVIVKRTGKMWCVARTLLATERCREPKVSLTIINLYMH